MIDIIDFFSKLINDQSDLINNILKEKQEDINSIDIKSQKIKSIESNSNNLKDYSYEELLDLVNAIDLDDELLDYSEIKKMINEDDYDYSPVRKGLLFTLIQIKSLYEADLFDNFTEEQKKMYDLFIDKCKSALNALKSSSMENDEKINVISKKIDRLKNIIDKLKEKNSTTIISDYTDMDEIIEDSSVSENVKMDIIYGLFKHNQQIIDNYSNEKKDVVIRNRNRKLLDKNAISEIFSKYGYDFDKLNEVYKDIVLSRGNLDNINNIFKSLFEKYEINKDYLNISDIQLQKVLVSLLINSSPELIDEVVHFSNDYGIEFNELIKNPLLFIGSKRDTYKQKKLGKPKEESDKTNIISGVAYDYMANVKFFKEVGIDVKDAFKKCITIFSSPYESVKYNYEIIGLYGGLDTPLRAYSALRSSHIEDVYDRFIELGNSGYQYIQGNKSRLLSDPDHLVFYQLYKQKHEIIVSSIKDYSKNLFHSYNEEAKTSIKEEMGIIDPVISEKDSKIKNTFDTYCSKRINLRKQAVYNEKYDRSKGNALFDYSINGNEIIKIMNERYANPDNMYSYSLNGVIISKNKFLKVFNTFTSSINSSNIKHVLLYSLTYNSILNQDEYNLIKSCVDDLLNIRRMG